MRAWLPLAIAVTAMCALIHVAVQQNYRQTANDPQIFAAEGMAKVLESGAQPKDVIPPGAPVDIADSLAPYFAVYDDSGKPLASSGQLNGAAPRLPSGVFDYVRARGEDRVTWQPEPGVRQAAVITRYGKGGAGSGFVLAARSLREIEKREDQLGQITLAAWLLTLMATLAACLVLASAGKKT